MKDLEGVIRALHEAGINGWTLVAAIFLIAIIYQGPQYLKVIATFFNEKRRINGNLAFRLKKLHLGVAEKRRRLSAKKNSRLERAEKKEIGRRS